MDSDFEKKLARQPMRELPPEWRAEILQTATNRLPDRQGSWLAMICRQARSILWPRPLAWTGLAAVWVAILALHFANNDAPQMASTQSPPLNWMAALREQQRVLDELVSQSKESQLRHSDETKPAPQSHWRRRQPFVLV